MKLTRWYPAHIKPVRVGFYEVSSGDGLFKDFYWWSGALWRIAPNSYFCLHESTNLKWRGLTAPMGVSK